MRLVPCTPDRHAAPILEIFNDAILTSTALYDYAPRTPQSMDTWFDTKARSGFPVIGAEDGEGSLLGFASYGSFRAWPAYKYTVEHSVYVRRDQRGRGLGSLLVRELIAAARERGVHVMVGAIDSSNAASLAMHRALGFVHAGTLRQVGFKFGRWLDVDFLQLTLDTPTDPVDG